ncbi:hypothetical protein [Stigmatella aurantiaca]|uniref:Conserved uncharacterized protein n=1 Tax=Stigmatella aurantiaca (strain DW4/3-1) TaxID=378806 RepID=Q09CW7_STIAD|nr:hypothetical protein [Stigmatella aurantiaca]ADO70125.1 conserved uncharacterized protein [Stigmatella aurantiaca DW4/3-1]EAU69520.1 conserved hypothetical protein [Stigmatella aurantiaca DW4/3-1]
MSTTTAAPHAVTMTSPAASWNLLRRALLADGAVSGATGTLMLVAASPLGGLLGLNVTLLRAAGLSLLPFAALLVFLSARAAIPQRLVWAIVGYNLLWAIDSVLLLVTGWADPTALGYLFTLGQALAVAAFAGLQYAGLRRVNPARA